MNSEENLDRLEFSLGELLKDGNNTATGSHYYPLQNEPANLKRIIRTADLNSHLAQKIANHIGLTFILDVEKSGNVCMANSAEVLPAFREICTGTDLLNYIKVAITSEENLEKLKDQENHNNALIAFPKDEEEFWKQVEVGSRLKSSFFKDQV